MPQGKNSRHPPPRWAAKIFKVLAVGRYAAAWLPELLILYAAKEDEVGEVDAFFWLISELALTFPTVCGYRAARVVRFVYRAWKLYEQLARN